MQGASKPSALTPSLHVQVDDNVVLVALLLPGPAALQSPPHHHAHALTQTAATTAGTATTTAGAPAALSPKEGLAAHGLPQQPQLLSSSSTLASSLASPGDAQLPPALGTAGGLLSALPPPPHAVSPASMLLGASMGGLEPCRGLVCFECRVCGALEVGSASPLGPRTP